MKKNKSSQKVMTKRIAAALLASTLVFGEAVPAMAADSETVAETVIISESEISTEPETESVQSEETASLYEAESQTEIKNETEPQTEKETKSETETEEESEAEALVGTFITNLYRNILERDPDPEGFEFWKKGLMDQTYTGAFVAQGFVESDELLNKKLSNEDYVEILYRSILGRASDPDGKATWAALLTEGFSNRFVFKGFAESVEFGDICQAAKVERGEVELFENRDQNVGLTKFVSRCYTEALGREPDYAGLNDWIGKLLEGKEGPRKVARGFVFSQEVANKNLSNDAYIRMLYKVLMGREGDQAGLNAWVGSLNNKSVTREYAFLEFANSAEFNNILAGYGLSGVDEPDKLTAAQLRIEKNIQSVYNQVGRNLNKCYWWVVNNTSYKHLPIPLAPAAGYTKEQWYAIQSFENHQGNCYCYAAAFYWLAKGLGYDARYVEGSVPLASGGYGPHGWVELKINGATYICDPELQDESLGSRYSFYMQPIGSTVVTYRR